MTPTGRLTALAGAGIAVLCAALTGCADDPPLVPPTELTPLSATVELVERWHRGVGDTDERELLPAVVDGVVYAAAADGQVMAFDAATGERRWRVDLDRPLASGVGAAGDLVIVGDTDGTVFALAAADGSERWHSAMSSEVLTPAGYTDGHVVVRSADGRVVSVDPASGDVQWSASHTPPALTLSGYSPPRVLSNGVLVGLDDGRLLALSLTTGATIWESILSIPSGRSEVERLVDIDGPIRIDDDAIYAANYQGQLARIEPTRGQIRWSSPVSSSQGLCLFEDTVAVVDEEDVIVAFAKDSGRELWRQDALRGRRLTTPQALGEILLVGDFEGWVHAIDAADGRLLGRRKLDASAILAEPVVADGVAYVQTGDGRLSALTPRR